jgi:hypothetical protein
MPAAGWMRRWRSGSDEKDHARAPVLAASLMDRPAAHEERAASSEMVRKIIEDSGECLVLVDEQGKILEASRAAAMLLFPPGGWMERSSKNYFPLWRAMPSPIGETGSARLPLRRPGKKMGPRQTLRPRSNGVASFACTCAARSRESTGAGQVGSCMWRIKERVRHCANRKSV